MKLMQIYNKFMLLMYQIFSKKKVIKISELFDEHEPTKLYQLLVALRYNAIKKYYLGQDDWCDTYLYASFKDINSDCAENDKKQFLKLIESFEEHGYNKSSLMMDRGGYIFNGTHRLALCIWHNEDEITVKQVPRGFNYKSVDELLKDWALSKEQEESIMDSYKEMFDKIHY